MIARGSGTAEPPVRFWALAPCGRGASGSASGSYPEGCEFKSRRPHQRFAPLAQMVERRSYKPEVGDSNPPRGTRFGSWGCMGWPPHLQCGQSGEFDSRTIHQDLSGHNSVAECLVANENVAGSIPADRSKCGVGIWAVPEPSKLVKRVRVPHAAPSFSGRSLVLKALALGARDRRLKSCRPDQALRSRLEPGSSMVS